MVAAGEDCAGVTVHWMDEGLDTGDILVQQRELEVPEAASVSMVAGIVARPERESSHRGGVVRSYDCGSTGDKLPSGLTAKWEGDAEAGALLATGLPAAESSSAEISVGRMSYTPPVF